ncbi:thioredoxin domain-containing protein [Maricaulis sp.]|uniref:DsbA family protein n=1 Tax=Maricaulis sp. TaxID=1486257 RepID=UPI00262FA675|nr:thioredoxin domain-containing protein [Maricaulis sp.]
MKLTRRLFSALALSSGLLLAACGGNSGSPAATTDYDLSKGSDTAPVTIVEYASVACGHCATFHEEVYPVLEENYVDTGQVRFVMREMITGSPQFAIAGFVLARCVSEDRYFDAIDLLFQQQTSIFRAAQNPGGARSQYIAIAGALGLSADQYDTCLADEDINQGIVDSHERAGAAGITGTPRFIFNGQLLDSRRAPGETEYTYFLGDEQVIIDGEPVLGLVDAETFSRLIDHLLAQGQE